MADELVQRFIDALEHLERTGDVERMAGLFAEDAELGNIAGSRTFKGPDGAREFWRMYLSNFGEVRSDFRRVIATDDGAALEWNSRGKGADGEPFEYAGVTLLDLRDGELARFHSYFDPTLVGAQLEGGHRRGRGGGGREEEIPAAEVTDTSYASPGRTP